MSGNGNLQDCFDIATLVEFTGVYEGHHSADFYDLYARARPHLVPRATTVSEIVSEYTSGACEKLDAAARCAEVMGAWFAANHFTTRSRAWEDALPNRPASA